MIHGMLLRQSASNSWLLSLFLRQKSVSLILLTKSEKLSSHWHLFMHNLHTPSKHDFYISFSFSRTDEKVALCTIWCKQTQNKKQYHQDFYLTNSEFQKPVSILLDFISSFQKFIIVLHRKKLSTHLFPHNSSSKFTKVSFNTSYKVTHNHYEILNWNIFQ